MPNLITTVPRAFYARLKALLAERMTPSRWLGLVVRARLEDPAPIQVAPERERNGVRIVGHARWKHVDLLRRRCAAHRSEAKVIWWIAHAAMQALEAGALPTDSMLPPRQKAELALEVKARSVRRAKRQASARAQAVADAVAEREALVAEVVEEVVERIARAGWWRQRLIEEAADEIIARVAKMRAERRTVGAHELTPGWDGS